MKLFIILILLGFTLITVSEQTNTPVSSAESTNSHRPADLQDALFSVETFASSGSAFLLQESNEVWLISNGHVFANGDRYNIQNSKGTSIEVPETIMVAADRDLIRFKTTQPAGLIAASSCEYEQKIFAFGDSGGIGALARLEGKVLAIGSDRIEISASIIPGNSGGPVVNEDNEVVGVSTYLLNESALPDWIIKDTRFEKTRRVALKLDRIEWIEMTITDYSKQVDWVKKIESGVDAFEKIIDHLSAGPYRIITCNYDNNDVQKWLRKHNRFVKDIREDNSYYSYSSARSENKSRNRKWKSILKSLQTAIRGFERDAGSQTRVTLPYFKEKMKLLEAFYRHQREDLETMLESI